MSDTTKILVPTDFTSVSECAINHAETLAKAIEAEIHLLHVIDDADEASKAKVKLEEQVGKMRESAGGTKIEFHTRVGNIFEDIGDEHQGVVFDAFCG